MWFLFVMRLFCFLICEIFSLLHGMPWPRDTLRNVIFCRLFWNPAQNMGPPKKTIPPGVFGCLWLPNKIWMITLASTRLCWSTISDNVQHASLHTTWTIVLPFEKTITFLVLCLLTVFGMEFLKTIYVTWNSNFFYCLSHSGPLAWMHRFDTFQNRRRCAPFNTTVSSDFVVIYRDNVGPFSDIPTPCTEPHYPNLITLVLLTRNPAHICFCNHTQTIITAPRFKSIALLPLPPSSIFFLFDFLLLRSDFFFVLAFTYSSVLFVTLQRRRSHSRGDPFLSPRSVQQWPAPCCPPSRY